MYNTGYIILYSYIVYTHIKYIKINKYFKVNKMWLQSLKSLLTNDYINYYYYEM